MQVDEDTDRDRYMSPLEAKQYGIIDHVIGGDEAGFKVRLSTPLSKAATRSACSEGWDKKGPPCLCLHLVSFSLTCGGIDGCQPQTNPMASQVEGEDMQAFSASCVYC